VDADADGHDRWTSLVDDDGLMKKGRGIAAAPDTVPNLVDPASGSTQGSGKPLRIMDQTSIIGNGRDQERNVPRDHGSVDRALVSDHQVDRDVMALNGPNMVLDAESFGLGHLRPEI